MENWAFHGHGCSQALDDLSLIFCVQICIDPCIEVFVQITVSHPRRF